MDTNPEDEVQVHIVPTLEEAKQLFLDSPGLQSLWTTEGMAYRKDVLGE